MAGNNWLGRLKNKYLLVGILIILVNGALVAKNNIQDQVTVTDFAGRTVTFKKHPQRVILVRARDIYGFSALLGEDIVNTLVAWGPDLRKNDQDGFKKFTEKYPQLKKLPEIGDMWSDAVDPEQLLALNPDLIVLDLYFKKVGPKSCEKLEKLGLPIIYTDQSEDPIRSPQQGMLLLGKIFGKEKRAKEIVAYADAQINFILERIKKHAGAIPSVYFETGNKGPDTISSSHGGAGSPMIYSGWAVYLHELGVKNICDGMVGSGMGVVNAEYILQQNPDIIVITGANWSTAGAMKFGYYTDPKEAVNLLNGFCKRNGWSNLNAVKNTRVYGIFHGYAMHIFDFAGLQALAKDFYPELFGDLNPEVNLETFYRKYMPITYSGTWMAHADFVSP